MHAEQWSGRTRAQGCQRCNCDVQYRPPFQPKNEGGKSTVSNLVLDTGLLGLFNGSNPWQALLVMTYGNCGESNPCLATKASEQDAMAATAPSDSASGGNPRVKQPGLL